jgi:hypothetical protein
MNLITRKRALAVVGCVSALAIAAVAYAYFTSTGSGTATAKVGTASAITLKGTVAGNLYPGASSQVTFTVDNPSSGAQRVGTISLTGITVDAGHSTCSVTIGGGTPDFSMPAVAVNATFPSGNGQAVTPKGTLTMNDTGVNQNACQGAELTLALASN